MSSSIKAGIKKISNKDKGFIIVQSDMHHILKPLISIKFIIQLKKQII